ncbi:MAG: MotA/TolQ/ExbB proton channel family protein [Oscillatoria sp. PMC 1051.18]|nr:MotA/TolQ/ExbB proton channel family protein [Oscillatoria sp. PMC 1050.18]MEC5028365.1 MotA/TolQ/ExbB proton channel family protein [Oscillatoria sp. PMC 1051.18]
MGLGEIVLIPLLGFSLVAIALIIERCIFWWRLQKFQEPIIKEFLTQYQSNSQTSLTLLENGSHFPLPRIFLAALELNNPTPEEFRLALETAAQAEITILKRFNTVFETIISIAPLLGLLGTILGLIEAFAALRLGDISNTNTAGVTGGISDALITTVAGLVVAIFTLLFANTFRGLYRRQLTTIQKYGGKLELLYRHYYQINK